MRVKFPGQEDAQATKVRVVDTSDDAVSPYMNGKDGKPLPFQMDLEYWTALKLIPWEITAHGTMTKGQYTTNKANNPLFGKYAQPLDGQYVMADPAVDVGLSGRPVQGKTLESGSNDHNTICIKRSS